MEELSQDEVDRLETEHGTIEVYESDFGVAAFRPARPQEWQRFLDEMSQEAQKSRALKNLVFACRVSPDKAEFEALIAARPGLVQAFGNQLVEFCGMHTVRVRKKS